MSRNSKAKRDARKKKEPDRPIRRLGAALQPHAQLLDADDTAIGGVGWRDGEWLLVLGSQVAARSDSAAMALAMLRHVVAVQERAGRELRLEASAPLLHAAGREAAALGRTLEEHLAELEQERIEREPLAPVVTPSLPH
ncbi:hypothetical protein [Lysobacter auxotrophicus]|uniref:Uncharacterized protein n=1 Tax=Lysobacter auxotrophicus TaxID=2992573 RepID=A0ABM8D9Y1_9GAMM|nr:hypothetical protein [Lysobacter auxotrophicus]BDU15348.1 hypothetical protein LA521A_05490 [Lysobacter auxotrophicus]